MDLCNFDVKLESTVDNRASYPASPTMSERKAAPAKLDTQVVGNVGLFYVCYHLSLRGWNVMPTSRNARGVDIVAYDASATRYVGVQVKALSKRDAVPVGSSLSKVMGDFWVVVNRIATEPQAYVLLPDEVRQLSHCSKSGEGSFWLEPRDYDVDLFRNAWGRIGAGHVPAGLPPANPGSVPG